MSTPDADARKRDLARIHVLIGPKALGLDRDVYEDVLWIHGPEVTSSRDLDRDGRRRVIQHLEQLLRRENPRHPTLSARQRPADHKAPLVKKVRALLINAPGGKRPDSYADAIARQMFEVQRFTWCDAEQLRKLIAALAIDGRRNGTQP